MKKTVLLLILVAQSVQAFIPFNPVIMDDGSAYQWNGSRKGIIGWLDVPSSKNKQFDRVLAIKLNDGTYNYVDPTNLDRGIPQGIYYWQSTSTKDANFKQLVSLKFKPKQNTFFPMKVIPTAAKSFAFNSTKNKYVGYNGNTWFNDYVPGQHKHPTTDVQSYFEWNNEDKTMKRLDRMGVFYDVMGVTEEYFREFFGNPAQLPGISQVTQYFSSNATGFKDFQRDTIVPGCEVLTIGNLKSQLKTKKPNANRIGKGSIELIGGYKEYGIAGGKFKDEIDTKNITNQVIQQTIDLYPGAYIARKKTDVRGMLADPKYKDAVFQVASTHALLEGDAFIPGKRLTDMLKAPVQGEEVAIATMGASIFRKYLMKPVDIFSKVGGVDSIGSGQLQANDTDTIQIGWHPNVPVNTGLYESYVFYEKNNKVTYTSTHTPKEIGKRLQWNIDQGNFNPYRNIYNLFNSVVGKPLDQRVNLALCAGHNMAGIPTQNQNDKTDAQIILQAMYTGTFALAALHNKKTVVLTLLGGGAFAGAWGADVLDWIVDTILRDENIEIISKYGLDIKIINYPDLRPHRIRTKAEITKLRNRIENEIAVKIANKNQELLKKPISADPLEKKLTEFAQSLSSLQKKLQ